MEADNDNSKRKAATAPKSERGGLDLSMMDQDLVQKYRGQQLSCTVGTSGLKCNVPSKPATHPLESQPAHSPQESRPAHSTRSDTQSKMSIGCAIPLLSENLGYNCHGTQHGDRNGKPLITGQSVAFNLLDEVLKDSVNAVASPALRPTYVPFHNHGRTPIASQVHLADLEREGVPQLMDRIRSVQFQLRKYKQAEAAQKHMDQGHDRSAA